MVIRFAICCGADLCAHLDSVHGYRWGNLLHIFGPSIRRVTIVARGTASSSQGELIPIGAVAATATNRSALVFPFIGSKILRWGHNKSDVSA